MRWRSGTGSTWQPRRGGRSSALPYIYNVQLTPYNYRDQPAVHDEISKLSDRTVVKMCRLETVIVLQCVSKGDGSTWSDTSANSGYSGNGSWREPKCWNSRGGVFSRVYNGTWLVFHGAVMVSHEVGSARSMSTKRELWPFDVGIGPVNRKNRVVSLPLTETALMADVKVDDVVAENAKANLFELRSAERNAG